MIKRVIGTLGLAGLLSIGLSGAAPTIVTKDNGDTYTVTFDRGAIFSCVVFRMTEPTEPDRVQWPDGHYAPRTCLMLDDSDVTSYVEEFSPYIFNPQTGQPYNAEWDVYAELQYPTGRNSFTTVETNRVRVRK
jgi:hypothetical protein